MKKVFKIIAWLFVFAVLWLYLFDRFSVWRFLPSELGCVVRPQSRVIGVGDSNMLLLPSDMPKFAYPGLSAERITEALPVVCLDPSGRFKDVVIICTPSNYPGKSLDEINTEISHLQTTLRVMFPKASQTVIPPARIQELGLKGALFGGDGVHLPIEQFHVLQKEYPVLR
jgi:hypothetical protein